MSLLSKKEVLNLKLNGIKNPDLKKLSLNLGLPKNGVKAEIIKRILESQPEERIIRNFIKQRYTEIIKGRRSIITDEDLKRELLKVKTFSWGVVQGQLDQKVQNEYVRKIVSYEDLLNKVSKKLHEDVTNYVICTWFNHWTTVLIEEHISVHKKVIPTLKNIKGIDIFFGGQPFDLKVTYIPQKYSLKDAIKNPLDLAIWMYVNQGAQRFGDDNRLFVILLDKDDPERSWKLKRDFALVFQKIDNFLDNEVVSEKDEIVFNFRNRTYTTITKVLMITK